MLFSSRYLRKLIVPLAVEQATYIVLMTANTMMMSYAGDAAVSAVALVDNVNMMFVTIFAALSTGGAVIVSQYLGNREGARANRSASQLIAIMMILSTATMALCGIFRVPLLALFFGSASADVMDLALFYFFITILCFPFMGLYNASAALFCTMGRANVTMYISISMALVNVVGNAIGIFGFHAGVAGIAVPSVIVRAVFALVIFRLVFNRQNQIWVNWHDILSWDGDVVKRILHIAVPNGIENGLFQLGRLLVTSIVSLLPTAQIAAYGVANSVGCLAIIMIQAINIAIIPVVGQCVGARKYDQAVYYTNRLMRDSYIFTAILSIAALIALPAIMSLYALSEEALYYSYVLVVMNNIAVIILQPTSFNLGNAIRAAGDARFTMYTGVISMFACRLACAYLLCIVCGLGSYGVWIGMFADWFVRSVVYVARFHGGKWKEFRAI